VSLACELCRERKVKCDGVQPSCGRCSAKSLDCVFSTKHTRAKVSTGYVDELKQRIERLESSERIYVNSLPGSNGTGRPRSWSMSGQVPVHSDEDQSIFSDDAPRIQASSMDAGAQWDDPPSQRHDSTTNEKDRVSSASSPYNERSHRSVRSSSAEARTDAMGAASGNGNPQGEFYGSSSALSFMRLVEAAAASSEESRGGNISGQNSSVVSSTYRMASGVSADGHLGATSDSWVLPPRRLADHYVSCYFTYVSSLYPFLHQPSFMDMYNAIWMGDSNAGEDTLLYCIVNIVFAFGCLFSSKLETPVKETTAQVYFERSKALLHFDLLDTGSLILVQALLLTGQYLQATNSPARCWNVIGLAIRVAQGLGLHRNGHISERPSCIEQQVSRRVWYGCILMDRVVGMTFGRPLMILHDFRVDPPCIVDDSLISDSCVGEQPPDKPSLVAFYGETIKLYDILADILKELYEVQGCGDSINLDDACFPSEIRTALLNNVMKLENRLGRFKEQIPKHLQADNILELPETSPFIRQSNVLYARYLHVRIMLYRPVLLPHMFGFKLKSSAGTLDGQLLSSVEKTVSKLCLMAAVELIRLIYENKDTANLPAWWYNIFYIYTSATVLLAAKLRPALETESDDQSMEVAWRRALELLRRFEQHATSATRCLRVLEVLHDRISSASQSESRPMFDILPNLIDPNTDLDDSNILLTMINDQIGPFSGFNMGVLLKNVGGQ
jgi:hypothetical protein